MTGGGERSWRGRAVTYCLVPADLAGRLLEPLRRHFAEDDSIEVIVQRRFGERRRTPERRGELSAGAATSAGAVDGGAAERRHVRDPAGRRVGERRAVSTPASTPALPRKAARHAERLVFVERSEPSSEQLEDLDTLQLVRRFQGGDAEAFSDLYLRYFDRVYSYLRVAFNDSHEAEDAAQHVFTKLFEALPRYERSRGAFRAWLFVIVRNHAITEIAKRSRIELVEAAELDRRRERDCRAEDPDLTALDWISDKDLLLFIERLPLAQRQVLMLRYMLDLPHAQVAQVLGKTSDDVRHLQSRALAFIRARLIALGREPTRSRLRTLRCPKQAPVLRMRRFSLTSSA